MTGTIAVVVIVVWLAIFVVGAAYREIKSPVWRRSRTAVGADVVGRAVVAAWRRPGQVVSGAAVCTLSTFVFAAVVGWWTHPDARLYIAVCGTVSALLGIAVWDHATTRGRPWREVREERRRVAEIRRAVAATNPDARVRAVHVSGVEATVQVEHVEPVDLERFGRAVHAPHVDTAAPHVMGHTVIRVNAAPPGWERWAAVHAWPGVRAGAAPDAPIPVGRDEHGDLVYVPRPGVGGEHVLVGGASGAGKSDLESVMIAELAHRDIDLWFADSKLVELAPWYEVGPVAKGPEESAKMLFRFEDLMMARYRELEEVGRRMWTGRPCVLFIDELAPLFVGEPKDVRATRNALNRILAMSRAAGLGVAAFMQRPSTKLIDGDTRDNFRRRCGLGMESRDGSEMIMGSAELASRYPAHEIPEQLPGVGWMRHGRTATMFRAFWLDDDALARAVSSAVQYRARSEKVSI